MIVGDVMVRHLEFIDPNASVRDAAILMGELDVSALPVGTAQELLGIVTDRDILYRLVADGRDPTRTRVLDIATRTVFSCRAEDPITSAMELMAAHNIRRLPVVDAGIMTGWLTLSDLSRRLLVDSRIVQKSLEEFTTTLGTDAGEQAKPQGFQTDG